jgi:hypothetical protein
MRILDTLTNSFDLLVQLTHQGPGFNYNKNTLSTHRLIHSFGGRMGFLPMREIPSYTVLQGYQISPQGITVPLGRPLLFISRRDPLRRHRL